MPKLDKAIEYVKHLVKNRRKPYAVAIDAAAKEFDLDMKQISNALNPPKRSIKWKKPNVKDEVGEYFNNPDTKSYLSYKGYQFNTEKDLIGFLSKGKMTEFHEAQLAGTENFTTNATDFSKELKKDGYSDSYDEMSKKLNKDMKISMPAPIVLKIGKRHYGFSGNKRVNLALRYELPVKVWLVEAEDIAPRQNSLF